MSEPVLIETHDCLNVVVSSKPTIINRADGILVVCNGSISPAKDMEEAKRIRDEYF